MDLHLLFLKSVGSRRKRISIRKSILSDNIFDFILSPILTLDPSENQSFPKILRRFYLFSKYLWKMPSLIQKVANLWKENKKHCKMIYEIPKVVSPALLMSLIRSNNQFLNYEFEFSDQLEQKWKFKIRSSGIGCWIRWKWQKKTKWDCTLICF